MKRIFGDPKIQKVYDDATNLAQISKENIEKIIDRNEKIEKLVDKTEVLVDSAMSFKKSAVKLTGTKAPSHKNQEAKEEQPKIKKNKSNRVCCGFFPCCNRRKPAEEKPLLSSSIRRNYGGIK